MYGRMPRPEVLEMMQQPGTHHGWGESGGWNHGGREGITSDVTTSGDPHGAVAQRRDTPT